ncbi:UDP-4-amino-4,6-dideoxy-N-acetyl-beta-L-altrosamine transaminase [Limnobacter sp.]|uniref:UDP-4-amino-4, 6-dideoxy-N-acetyl-beta-L-altrosamine transaminase n=1 Tax=Limnobacter sp. TaxID=2003368 RepID=UPI002FE21BFF
MIPYGRQQIDQQDIDAVIDVLRSDFLTQGPAVPAFENRVASYCKVPHAVAVNSATSALHIACMALEVGPGDLVWTSPISFVASSNCALYCGANIDFVDIDPATYNLSIEALQLKLQQAEAAARLPKVLIAVHLSGQSCPMREINELSKQYGFKIIEDASHAIGGRYLGLPVGNCEYSDITVFSFHPVKIITTAEGGMATTRQKELATRMQLYRSHGITRDSELMTHQPDGAWYYQQIELGYNYRMTDLQAALGLSQMDKLDTFIEQRHAIATRYNTLLVDLPAVMRPYQHQDTHSALHLYIIRLHLDQISVNHTTVFDRMRAKGIGVNLHYIPIHLQPYYQRLGFKKGDFPNAEKFYSEAVSIPMYSSLSFQQQDQVLDALRQSLSK